MASSGVPAPRGRPAEERGGGALPAIQLRSSRQGGGAEEEVLLLPLHWADAGSKWGLPCAGCYRMTGWQTLGLSCVRYAAICGRARGRRDERYRVK